MASNAKRFIDAYNRLDKGMRDIYNIKSAVNFSDCVRKVASVNSVIRKYEDTIIEYGRLRNAIVHNDGEETIAEPNTNVVEKIESIARLICTPPRVMDTVANRSVFCVESQTQLSVVLKKLFETGYSVVPVYERGTLVGVINRKMIVEALGAGVSAGVDLDDLSVLTVAEALDLKQSNKTYEVVSSSTTIDGVLYLFQSNRKLSVVIVTKNGNYDEQPIGVVVTSDTIDMQTILDNY